MDVSWMYTKPRRRKPERRPSPKKYYYIIGAAVFVFFIVLVSFFMYSRRVINVMKLPTAEDCARVIERAEEGRVFLRICEKDDGALILLWENLPEGTSAVNIFRSKEGEDTWALWKAVAVTSGTGGVELGSPDDAGSYSYSFTATSDSGETLWVSEGALSEELALGEDTSTGTSPVPSGGAPGAGGQEEPSGTRSETPADDSTGDSGTLETPPADAEDGTETTPPPSGEVYYTPEGEVSGTGPEQTANFWVVHVHKKIEIGWQNLPAGTDRIKVERSKSQSSGYTKLLEQNNPEDPDFIRLDDHTIYENYYYRMKTYSGSTLIESYSPVFLPALE